jgi:anti-sigma factor RsiW
MSCSPFDLRDFFLKELADPQRRQVEAHVKTCPACREELDRLQLMEAALFSLREEEIPQRIAFVSDPVFEPSPVRRFLSDFWGSAARLGFASAAMLSMALVVFALHRPAPASLAQTPNPAVQTQADLRPLIDAAVSKAVAEAQASQIEKTRELADELKQARQGLLLAAQELDQVQKRSGTRYFMAAANYGPPKGDLR